MSTPRNKLMTQLHQVAEYEVALIERVLASYPCHDVTHTNTLFALLLHLHSQLMQGNTAILLSDIAEQVLFASQEETNSLEAPAKAGIRMPKLDSLLALVQAWIGSQKEAVPYILKNNMLMLERYYCYEQEIANGLSARTKQLLTPITPQLNEAFGVIFPVQNTLNWQAIATANVLNQQFMVLNGGPGTGKTYTVARMLVMLQVLHQNRLNVALCAPTGKAAQRLTESFQAALNSLRHLPEVASSVDSLDSSAVTIHRLLGLGFASTRARRNAQKPLACDVLVLDEASMLDTALFAKLLRALRPDARLILVGDANQLPSVEAGNVFADICHTAGAHLSPQQANFISALINQAVASDSNNPADHVITLQQNWRSQQSINAVAQLIQAQDLEALQAKLNAIRSDISSAEYRNQTREYLWQKMQAYFERLQTASSAQQALRIQAEWQILSPVRQGPLGVEGLNQRLIEQLHAHQLVKKSSVFQGMPIMITRNDSNTGLSNGDLGIIWPAINQQGEYQLFAHIENGDQPAKTVSINRLPPYECAFAMTIHKTQGSEFDDVDIVTPDQQSTRLSRELLYTAVTRAKHSFKVMITQDALEKCLNTTNARRTYLRYLLSIKD